LLYYFSYVNIHKYHNIRGVKVNAYDGLFIVKPELKEEDLKSVLKTINESIAKNGGSVKKEESWGRRQLAYPVKKFKEGYYYKLDFEVQPAAVSKIEAMYKLNPDVLRVMITRK